MTEPRAPLPTWCTELELGGALPAVLPVPDAAPYRTARLLLRLHSDAVGYTSAKVRDGVVRVDEAIRSAPASALARAAQHLREEGFAGDDVRSLDALPEPNDACPARVPTDLTVSVAVCTRDRAEMLRHCLERLRLLTYPVAEILVVDNAPTDDATAALVEEMAREDPRLRYVREDRAGLSCARNRALAEAVGEVVAFTDDDVSVDPRWVHGIVRGFRRRPDVGCVTGLVCTASIHNVAEAYFDARVSWSVDKPARVYDLRDDPALGPLYPYSAGLFGTGANLAVSKSVVIGLGGFDEALGAGTPTKGGEDLDVFVRTLRAGWSLAFEPSAVVWHHHRADLAGLAEQMYGYGTGLSAYLTKLLVDPSTRSDVLRRLPAGLARMLRIPFATQRSAPAGLDLPHGLLRREAVGMLHGPLLYRRARRRAARVPAGVRPAQQRLEVARPLGPAATAAAAGEDPGRRDVDDSR